MHILYGWKPRQNKFSGNFEKQASVRLDIKQNIWGLHYFLKRFIIVMIDLLLIWKKYVKKNFVTDRTVHEH